MIVSRGEPVQVDPASQALAEAQSLLERGRIDAAHSHLMSNIPESSNARRSETFRAIENAWADEQLRRAQQQPGRDEKRSYLERVVKSTTVDLERRRRAAEYLATLDTDGVSPNQLNPSSPSGNDSSRGALEDTASAAGSDPRALAASGSSSGGPGTTVRSGTTVKNTGVLQGSLPSGTGPGSLRPTGAGASTTGQGTAGSTLAGRSPLLLREDPYAEPGRPGDPKAPRSPTPNAMDEATSGDRAKQMAAKDQLKSKCASGHCTDQEKRTLRALCRAFSDPGCSR